MKQIVLDGIIYNALDDGPYSLHPVPNDPNGHYYIAGSDGVNCISHIFDLRTIINHYQARQIFNLLQPEPVVEPVDAELQIADENKQETNNVKT